MGSAAEEPEARSRPSLTAPPVPGAEAAPRELDDVDREMLGFAAQHRFVVTEQLAAVARIDREGADERVEWLRDAGLLSSQFHLHEQPAAHQITRLGLRTVASDLPATPAVNLSLYRHDLGLGWLMVLAQRGRFGRVSDVIGEREMRSRDGRIHPDDDVVGTRRLGIVLPGEGPGGGPRVHYPDLLLVTPGGRRVAIELELSTKSPIRRERILQAYLLAPRVDAVLYLVPTRAAGRAIARSAARVGASDLVHVQNIRFPEQPGRGGDQRARQVGRDAARGGAGGRGDGGGRGGAGGRRGADGRGGRGDAEAGR
jgi:hypothetical protein